MQSKKSLVFMSYCHADADLVLPIAERLQNSGVRVWLDRWELKVGSKIVREIEDGLRSADALVIFLSKNSVISKWVREEYEAAKSFEIESGLKILPVVLDGVAVPTFLASTYYADYRDGVLSVTCDLVDAIVGDKRLFQYEKELRSWIEAKPKVTARTLRERKRRAVKVAKLWADDRLQGVYYSMRQVSYGGQFDKEETVAQAPKVVRDYTQWLVVNSLVECLENLEPKAFSKTRPFSIVVDELYLRIMKAHRDHGTAVTKESDQYLAADLDRVLAQIATRA